MQWGYGDESSSRRGRDGEITYGEKGLEPGRRWWLWLSDLCERWRAEQKPEKRCSAPVHAAQRLSRDHSPSRRPAPLAAAAVAAAPKAKLLPLF